MKKHVTFRHEFVESFPDKLEPGILYISMSYATATHECACGCGKEVVTPLSPTDWQLYFDGVSISLAPSIGNWNFPCRSHYFVRHNRVEWARQWTKAEIEAGHANDQRETQKYFEQPRQDKKPAKRSGRWRQILKRFI